MLDKLAQRGMRFTQFYTTSPVCTPSRASFMTGRHPQRFNSHHADLPESTPRYPLPLDAVTPEMFRSTAKHPCCDVVPLLSAAARKIGGAYRKYSESRARREVREAIKAYEAHMQAQRAQEAKP